MKSYVVQRITWLLAFLLLANSPLFAQNLALGKAAIASSAVQAASNAFDGNSGTRWESSSSDPQYIIVDLGSVQSIDRIRLSWETALGKDFTLDISAVTAAPSDASWTNVVSGTWATAKSVTGNASTTNDYTDLGKSGRYVRMRGTARGTGYGYSLFEFAVYPYDPNPNLAFGKLATASANPMKAAANAFDADGKTRWESAYTDAQYIMVDLGSVQTIDRIRLTWEAALGKDFTLDVSNDGTNWQTAVTVTGNTSTSNEYPNLGQSGRYVRMNGIARGTVYGYSLYEFEVFAASNNATNIANTKPAVASTTQGTLLAGYAFDNDRLTRWASTAGREDASIYVDLRGEATISRVYLVWEKAYGGDFTIEVSEDAQTWTTVATTVGNSFHFNEYSFTTPVTGRYVRMNGTKRGTTVSDNGYSLYEFQVNGTLQPLPVTLTSFSVAVQGAGVVANWATASEQHNAGFEVQRSADGASFTTLATVAGMGTTQSAHTYSYFDAAPLRTTSYYRLKQLDLDGTFAYSPVVAVQVAAASTAALSIYPNPTADRATVTWETPIESAGRWYLTNSTGQVVHAELLSGESASTLTLDLQAYPAGSYVLTVESAGKVLRRARVQKSN
ncbi:T9SS type A sorting domain-containing protein [Hymenobacter setariae]|uniref:T9SS type A sorting domain-containing protein n=1 Tax=Hymenobacter setariae TaxID=2594794 RepID=A0A558BRI8_9BACT|nr:discoidin domain-containing protein [Hymenobacter setariae]TVT39095.1 T9SS type A sorting domain-containing protein [Hymenobacter setariae]